MGLPVAASSPHPRGLLTGVAAAVDGRRLEGVEAVGKHLLLRFDGGVTVRSHLRLNGRQDQRLVAGIGNMWMAEALWAARVSPWLPVGEASDEELLAALQWARAAMLGSVAGVRPSRSVYRRVGRPCRRCGTPLESRGQGVDNRTAYWCSGCQRQR